MECDLDIRASLKDDSYDACINDMEVLGLKMYLTKALLSNLNPQSIEFICRQVSDCVFDALDDRRQESEECL